MMKGKITILFLILTGISFAQTAAWELIAESPEFAIEKSTTVCKSSQGYDYEYTILRFTNLSNEDISINYMMEKWYNDVCSNCEVSTAENLQKIVVPANTSITGDCNSGNNLKVFNYSITVHPNAYKSRLTDLNIIKISSTKF